MITDTFDGTKNSVALIGKKRCYSTILRTPWIHGMPGTGIKDNGVFVLWKENYEDRNHSKTGC